MSGQQRHAPGIHHVELRVGIRRTIGGVTAAAGSPIVTYQAFFKGQLPLRQHLSLVFRRAPDRPDHESMPYLSDHAALHLELSVGA